MLNTSYISFIQSSFEILVKIELFVNIFLHKHMSTLTQLYTYLVQYVLLSLFEVRSYATQRDKYCLLSEKLRKKEKNH